MFLTTARVAVKLKREKTLRTRDFSKPTLPKKGPEDSRGVGNDPN